MTDTDVQTTLREIDASIDQLASSGDFTASKNCSPRTSATTTRPAWARTSASGWTVSNRWWAGASASPSSIHVELHGDLAVAMGDLDIVWGDGRHNYDRYVRVYRQVNDSWRVVSQRTLPAHDRAPAKE